MRPFGLLVSEVLRVSLGDPLDSAPDDGVHGNEFPSWLWELHGKRKARWMPT